MLAHVRIGADPAALDAVAATFEQVSATLERVPEELAQALAGVEWEGPDRRQFGGYLTTTVRPRCRTIADRLADAGTALRRQADQQRHASGDGGGQFPVPVLPWPWGSGPPNLPGPPAWPGGRPPFGPLVPVFPGIDVPGLIDGLGDGDGDVDLDDLVDAYGDVSDHVVTPILTALKINTAIKLIRAGSLAALIEAGQFINLVHRFKGLGAARVFGAGGAGLSLGLDIWNLIQQGNPIDAFNADPASYSSDIAQTLFDGSMLAFFIAPNPYTAGAVVITGLIWAGTEVWDHWPEITAAFDSAVDWTGDRIDDLVDVGGDVVNGVTDLAGDAVDTVKDTAKDLPIVGGLF
jgi:hypothetical protein